MAGANPQLALRISANTAELLKAMAEGRAAIGTLEESGKKLSTTWAAHSNAIVKNAIMVTEGLRGINVATLTAADAAKNLKRIEEGMTYLRQAGQPVPPLMQETAEKLRAVGAASATTSKQTTDWAGGLASLRNVLGALGVSLSVGAIVNFGKELLRTADELTRVADRTGMTTDEVQKMSYAATQSGNTLEELTGSIGQMQNRLASGDKSAIAAFKDLGVNLTAITRMGPAQQFETIAAAIAKVENPARQAQIAMDVFGRTGIAVLPTIKANYEALTRAAPVMSRETVKALDDIGDMFDRVKLTVKAWAANSLLFMESFMSGFTAQIMRGIAAAYDFAAKALGVMASIPGAAKLFPGLTAEVNKLRESAQWYRDAADGAARKTEAVSAAVRTVTPLVVGMGESHKAAAKEIADTVKKQEAFLASVDAATAKVREHLPYMVRHLDGYRGLRAGIDDVLTVMPLLSRETDTMAAATSHMYRTLPPLLDEERKQVDSLGALSQAFAQLSQIAGGAMGALARAVGSATAAFNIGRTAIQSFSTASGSLLSALGPFTTIFAGITTAVDALNEALGLAGAGGMQRMYDANVRTLQSIVDTHGGLEAFRGQLEAAGLDMNYLVSHLNSDNFADVLRRSLERVEAQLQALNNFEMTAKEMEVFINLKVGAQQAAESAAAAMGGLVTEQGVRYLGRGAANILPFRPRGTDTVPAMLTPGESVLTVGATRYLGVGTIGALNRGEAPRVTVDNAEMVAELRALRAHLMTLPETMRRSVRDAVLLATA